MTDFERQKLEQDQRHTKHVQQVVSDCGRRIDKMERDCAAQISTSVRMIYRTCLTQSSIERLGLSLSLSAECCFGRDGRKSTGTDSTESIHYLWKRKPLTLHLSINVAVLVSVQESLHERLMATQRELEGEKRQSLTRIEEKLREKKTSHTQEKDKVNS